MLGVTLDAPHAYRNTNFALVRLIIPALWRQVGNTGTTTDVGAAFFYAAFYAASRAQMDSLHLGWQPSGTFDGWFGDRRQTALTRHGGDGRQEYKNPQICLPN